MLTNALKHFKSYKSLGEKTFAQLDIEAINNKQSEDSNSIAMIVQHLSGNMQSRWTNIFSEDGEKTWRDRDSEFADRFSDKETLMNTWELGWAKLFETMESLANEDLSRTIYIRNEPHTVEDAIIRQLCHYAYHIGQIVHIGKCMKGANWSSLSIPKGGSAAFNAEKFKQ